MRMARKERADQIVKLMKEGKNYAQIAKEMGVTGQYINLLVSMFYPEEMKFGKNEERAKFKEQEKERVKALREQGYSFRRIGLMYGHSDNWARSILSGGYVSTASTEPEDTIPNVRKDWLDKIKASLKIGDKVLVRGLRGEVIGLYKYHFLIKTNKGYKESFLYADYVKNEVV